MAEKLVVKTNKSMLEPNGYYNRKDLFIRGLF